MSQPQRIGVMGGTFDPVHNAHLDIARLALEDAKLDLVLFVVASEPPHKKDETFASPPARFAMVEAALVRESRFEACDLELRREGPSYTHETLSALRERFGEARLFLIVGQDSLVDFLNWREPERILEHADLLVAPRPGEWSEATGELLGKHRMLPFGQSLVSSTEVRRKVALGESISELVPAEVADYICENDLYHDPSPD